MTDDSPVFERFVTLAKRELHADDVRMLAVGEDFRYPQSSGPKPAGTDLINAYIARVHRAPIHDPVICRAFVRVMHLLAPPASLFHPRIVVRALFGRRQARRGEAVATNPAT